MRATLALLTTTLALAILPASASAVAPELLWQSPGDGIAGSGAGQLDNPYGIAADPNSGHVYVADGRNARVSEVDAWGQFVKAWGWGVANGAAELQTCGPEATPPTATCLKGIKGSGAGQFAQPLGFSLLLGGIAVDAIGNVYVGDMENFRIEKFDSEGNFLLMFGGGVNETTGGDVCTAVSGNTCRKGTKGEGDGEFTGGFRNYIAAGPAGTIFVGDDKGRIQEFEPSGAFKSKIILEGELGGKRVLSLAIDGTGNFYVIANGDTNHVYKFGPAGALLSTIAVELATESPLALNAAGNLYVVAAKSNFRREVVEFGPSGAPIIPVGSGFAVQEGIVGSPEKGVSLTGLATNTVTAAGATDIYVSATSGQGVSFVSAYGPPPDKWLPPKVAPEITSQYAVSVDSGEALLRAQINPRFWADTSYYLEYGTGKCSEGDCTNLQPIPPGDPLGAGVVSEPVTSKGVALPDLQPGTTYHYRFVAQSGGSEGQPVRGVGGKVGADGAEASFTTPLIATVEADTCANVAFRTAASAKLPDCRAYEMVSPVDKNNSDIIPLINVNSNLVVLDQSSTSGEALTYTTSQGFGDAKSAPYSSQYIAGRGAGGWQSHGISPPQGLSPLEIGQRIDLEFRFFTDDLCAGVLRHSTEPPLAPGAVKGYVNVYRRQNCAPGADTYTALTTSQPPSISPATFTPEVQAVSPNGRCTVYYADDQLTPDANPGGKPAGSNRQLYESCGEGLHLISVLPDGTASKGEASAGTSNQSQLAIRSNNLTNAVSADGSRVYWTASKAGAGKLYLRVNAEQEQSKISSGGNCTQPIKACTIDISATVGGAAAHFWSAAGDGSTALFTIEEAASPLNGNLYAFDLASKTSTLIAGKVAGVVGASEDASRVYFASRETLTGANAEGRSPSAGKPNLYLFDASKSGADRYRFVATLIETDAKVITPGGELTPVNAEPYKRISRVSPDGRSVAFMSRASLTGYDNVDLQSGQADAEIFIYDASADGDSGELRCVSCNPTGQRPSGRNIPVEGQLSGTWAAALLPPYATELYGSRVISDDGNRVFFNSFESLVPRGDANGKADVYQWEAPGTGSCSESASAFSPSNGGCLSLISSGESPTDSVFLDASPSGEDVFFATASSLLPQDPGLIDIYDARAGGGYPPPEPLPAQCEGDACQGPSAAPNDPTPASSSFEGAGNPRPRATKPRCPKGKRSVRRAGKARCVKVHKKHRANRER
jgi:NHL repeat